MGELCNELAIKSVPLTTKYHAKDAFEGVAKTGAVAGSVVGGMLSVAAVTLGPAFAAGATGNPAFLAGYAAAPFLLLMPAIDGGAHIGAPVGATTAGAGGLIVGGTWGFLRGAFDSARALTVMDEEECAEMTAKLERTVDQQRDLSRTLSYSIWKGKYQATGIE
jgi:hypothetical protein